MSETLSRTSVPFLDLAPAHGELKGTLLARFGDLIDSNAFSNGPEVEAFESEWSEWCGTTSCVGVASGLDALRLALIAAGIQQGDEVLVPALTFVATFEAVTQAGGIPVPVDVSADATIDVAAVDAGVSPSTRFVLPVHLYGQLCDMHSIAGTAARAGLAIIEDACQAHGAARAGVRPGGRSLAAAFSFYPGKNLGAMGDAGALVTNDRALAERVRTLREHGQRRKYHHEVEGWTARLDTIQAIVLSEKLRRLDDWNAQRRALAQEYLERLAGTGDLLLPAVASQSEPCWHLFVVRTASPELLAQHLATRGIATGRHYPEPPHLSGAYAHLGYVEGDFPVAEALAGQCLSLPLFPGMTAEQVDAVVDAVETFFDG